MQIEKIGFGGGCHWCTEAVFNSLKGVVKVDQGWITSYPPNDTFSEAVLVHFDPIIIPHEVLIDIHLRTHRSISNHSMRGKYRSAVYSFPSNHEHAVEIINKLSAQFETPVITEVLPYVDFESSPDKYKNYFEKNRGKPFCETYISPKLGLLMNKFRKNLKEENVLS